MTNMPQFLVLMENKIVILKICFDARLQKMITYTDQYVQRFQNKKYSGFLHILHPNNKGVVRVMIIIIRNGISDPSSNPGRVKQPV